MTTIATTKENTFGAILMVAGCCIGAGMIGLPILTAATGFFPSSLAMVFAYLFSTGAGLLLLEAALWFEGKVNLLSMAQFTLGRAGKILTGALFLFLFYSIFVAYTDAAGHLIGSVLGFVFQIPPQREIGIVLSSLFVGAMIYRGLSSIDRINRIFMIGLTLSYALLITGGLPHVQLKNLDYVNWKTTLATLPILFICFGYQNLVPSLTYYLRRNVAATRFAILAGNLIPLVFYSLWNFVILGMISQPETIPANTGLVTELLKSATASVSILLAVQAFSFFALFSSFITIAISFLDFLKDAFRTPPPDFLLQGLVLIPPALIALSYPHLFLQALSFAGGFIDVLLFGILPIGIVWMGRYVKKAKGPYQVAGGKTFLILMLLLSIAILLLRIF
jgi:tyrosine-specific transport protein